MFNLLIRYEVCFKNVEYKLLSTNIFEPKMHFLKKTVVVYSNEGLVVVVTMMVTQSGNQLSGLISYIIIKNT